MKRLSAVHLFEIGFGVESFFAARHCTPIAINMSCYTSLVSLIQEHLCLGTPLHTCLLGLNCKWGRYIGCATKFRCFKEMPSVLSAGGLWPNQTVLKQLGNVINKLPWHVRDFFCIMYCWLCGNFWFCAKLSSFTGCFAFHFSSFIQGKRRSMRILNSKRFK